MRAFRRALASFDAPDNIRVDTAPNHLLQLLRSHYALAGVRPDLRNGGPAAAREIVREAAAGLLDLTWPELGDGELDLNIPFLSRPDKFLDEAAALMTQLRGSRVSPEEFERGSVAGLQAFYGDEVEAALAKARDPAVLGRVSKRGREALRAGPDVLQSQKRAERDLGILLARLYREYLTVARSAPLASDEDIVDECLRWLVEDGRSCSGDRAQHRARDGGRRGGRACGRRRSAHRAERRRAARHHHRGLAGRGGRRAPWPPFGAVRDGADAAHRARAEPRVAPAACAALL